MNIMKTLREKLDEVNGSFRKLQGYYIFLNGSQEDYCKARSREEAAKLFQRANKRLTGRLVPLDTVLKFITPGNKVGSEIL